MLDAYWDDLERNIKIVGDRFDVDIWVYARNSDIIDEIDSYLIYLDKMLSDAFNSQASINHSRYEFEKEFGGESRGFTRGIITNSFTYKMAFAVSCAIEDTMRDIARERKATNSWEENQRILINKLNYTWGNSYTNKIIPMIKAAMDEVEKDIKEELFKQFGCTEEEFNSWSSEKVDNTTFVQAQKNELKGLIDVQKKIITENDSWWPFGTKAEVKKEAEKELHWLEQELYEIDRPKVLAGNDFYIVNHTVLSWSDYDYKTKKTTELHLKFNKRKQVYEIFSDDENRLLGQMDRTFTCLYGRYREIYGKVSGFGQFDESIYRNQNTLLITLME